MVRTSKAPVSFKEDKKDEYLTAGEKMTVEEKLSFLKEIGREELIDVFKGYKPRQVRKRRAGAPLDQKVSISITEAEKIRLDNEVKKIKETGEKITSSQIIRNRALSTVDIHLWAEIVEPLITEMNEIKKEESSLRYRKRALHKDLDETDYSDAEDIGAIELELSRINEKLDLITARSIKRKYKLSGRMSMAEAETVRWRAQRLCLSTSDYLRMVIFGLDPNTDGDRHMSFESKQRFYLSILQVAKEGFGTSPQIYGCSQCVNYQEEIERLSNKLKIYEDFD